jgi:hypothetical protein
MGMSDQEQVSLGGRQVPESRSKRHRTDEEKQVTIDLWLITREKAGPTGNEKVPSYSLQYKSMCDARILVSSLFEVNCFSISPAFDLHPMMCL